MDNLDIPVFKKTYDLYKELHLAVVDFPKQEKYSLGQRCESLVLEILELIIEASFASKEEKSLLLSKASLVLNVLRINLRLASEIKCLNTRTYIFIQEKIDEIGRMLGGWIRMVKASK